MGEVGTVISIDGNVLNVVLKRNTACEKCAACISFSPGNEEMLIRAQNLCDAKIGDSVVIDISSRGFLKATAAMYILPCALFIMGLFIGRLFNSDILGFVIGGSLTAFVYIFIRLNRRLFTNKDYTVYAVEIV